MIEITVYSQSNDSYAILEEALLHEGYQLKRHNGELKELDNEVEKNHPDALIVTQEDHSCFDTVKKILEQHPIPVVVFTEKESPDDAKEAVRIGISAYVVNGLQSHRVIPILEMAMERFLQLSELRKELEQTKLTLAERKLIEKAKGILMYERGCNEDEAYHALRKMAMKNNKRLVEVAEAMLMATDMLAKN